MSKRTFFLPGLQRIVFDRPKAGRFVFHCHILEHEDKGMMTVMDVVQRQ